MAFYRDIKYRASDAPSSNVENLDTITFDGNSSYSLTKDSVSFTPNSSDNVLVSIDGVVQSGNFTISGSTIDFGTAVPSTSVCDFILHLGVGAINTPADGSVTNSKIANGAVSLDKLSATGTKDSTTFLRGDNTFATVSPSMYPAFHATSNVGQSVAQDTTVKVQYNTEVFDTDSCYDTSNYRFTPNKAGKYFIYAVFRYETSNDFQSNQMWIYKNGSEFIQVVRPQQHYTALDGQAIVECNGSTDYIEIYARQESGSGSYTMSNNSKRIYFYGYRIGA